MEFNLTKALKFYLGRKITDPDQILDVFSYRKLSLPYIQYIQYSCTLNAKQTDKQQYVHDYIYFVPRFLSFHQTADFSHRKITHPNVLYTLK